MSSLAGDVSTSLFANQRLSGDEFAPVLEPWKLDVVRRSSDVVELALSKEIQEQLVAAFKAGPTNLKATVPAALRGQPGVFTTPAEWNDRGYIMNDEVRATSLAAWKEWFNANIVAK